MDKTALTVLLPLWVICILLPGVSECGVSGDTWTVIWTLALVVGGPVLVERSAKKPLTWPVLRQGRTRYAVEFETETEMWDEN